MAGRRASARRYSHVRLPQPDTCHVRFEAQKIHLPTRICVRVVSFVFYIDLLLLAKDLLVILSQNKARFSTLFVI
jgi:hypothetical protein